jgi:hypothetical protein
MEPIHNGKRKQKKLVAHWHAAAASAAAAQQLQAIMPAINPLGHFKTNLTDAPRRDRRLRPDYHILRMQQPSCSLHDLAIKVLLPSPSSTLQSDALALLNAITAAAATVGDDFENLDRAAFALMTNSVSRVSDA